MTQDEEVRLLEIATKLVLGPLADESVESINALGGWLAQMTTRDREQVERGERWGQGSRSLSQGEARKVLRGLSIDEMEAFAERWEYCLDEVIEWSREQREIHGGALWLSGQQDEMAKITGGER